MLQSTDIVWIVRTTNTVTFIIQLLDKCSGRLAIVEYTGLVTSSAPIRTSLPGGGGCVNRHIEQDLHSLLLIMLYHPSPRLSNWDHLQCIFVSVLLFQYHHCRYYYRNNELRNQPNIISNKLNWLTIIRCLYFPPFLLLLPSPSSWLQKLSSSSSSSTSSSAMSASVLWKKSQLHVL